MTAALLNVDRLSVTFAGTRGERLVALDGVSFDLRPGEMLGMVGESGAGKSVTGAVIAGLLDASATVSAEDLRLGDQSLLGLSPHDWRSVRGRQIATIFQDPLTALDPLYTVGQHLTETLRTHFPMSRTEARRRAAALLAETGIPAAESRLDDYPHEFSGGMRQRVVIALALAGEPRLLVADEPTTALDVSVQAQIMALLRRLCRERGLAVLLITHDLGVVADCCDRVAVMYAGRLVELGPVAEVIGRPSHPYTAGLMAAIPTLDAPPGRLRQIDGAMPRLSEVPAGCAFHPRCPARLPRCEVERPPSVPVGATDVACWLYPPEVA